MQKTSKAVGNLGCKPLKILLRWKSCAKILFGPGYCPTFAMDAAGARYPLAGTLTELERQLDPRRFGRLNRSELVNVAFVEKMEPYFNNRLAVQLRTRPPVTLTTSAAQTPEFRRWLEG